MHKYKKKKIDGKEKSRGMENCVWRNTLFKQRGCLFFQERSKGYSTESLSVLFTCQLKGQMFLLLACDLPTEKMKCVKNIYAQIFQKRFSMTSES